MSIHQGSSQEDSIAIDPLKAQMLSPWQLQYTTSKYYYYYFVFVKYQHNIIIVSLIYSSCILVNHESFIMPILYFSIHSWLQLHFDTKAQKPLCFLQYLMLFAHNFFLPNIGIHHLLAITEFDTQTTETTKTFTLSTQRY